MSDKKALVVDDGAMNRSFIKTFLTVKGFDVTTAEDGLKGLEAAKGDSFHIVFSDIEMPNMNGLEFLKNLKRLDVYKAVPVIVLSTVDKPEVIERAKKLGAVHYMIKPFTEEKMGEALKVAGVE
jgi:two-component system, chemotaxis family, chemotaxis protein CheY